MSDNKNSNRKILTVLLLLIFVGAGIFYFTMNLDESEFAEPMNEEELELLEDESEDEPNDEPEGELDEEPEDTTSVDVDDLDTETTRTDDETDDQTDDPDDSTSHIDDQDIQDSPADSPDLDDDRTAVDDGEDPEHDPEIAEEPAVTEDENDGIIDRIISFLSEPFREEDPEDIAIDDIDDIEEIEDINDIDDLEEITEEELEQADSPIQLASKNLVVLGIDDLSDQQELSFDFIGLISFNAEDLEIEFKIIPSRYTYEDQEIRTLSRQELTAIISEITGLEIDYELVLDYSGFQYYVDEIGGIELELADDFIIPDLELELTQGNNYLDGAEALNYARFYNPDNGERSRINRQQEVIDKIYHKSLRLENILRLPGHYNHLINEKEAVDTDIDQELIRNTIRYIRQLDQLSIKYSIFND
ncbi:LCP family protein [Halanaerobiaceae bacterium Z-7014]|uniref:LCP family protein n=1 Tax=Halonatronomonas betaini TaxID=2778430 RepID=A0A931ATN5_9FIRM|nr:LCP family protein [Halonatronomonas betaini]MBF8436434.1 LCP family protein [Halonatronomonas betaini]